MRDPRSTPRGSPPSARSSRWSSFAIYIDVARSRHHLSICVWGAAALIAALVIGLGLTSIRTIAATTAGVLLVLADAPRWSILREPSPAAAARTLAPTSHGWPARRA